uniref:NADP-dependent oxidoreductase domain-containing protein n=1 Tax=Panagrolaimus davidi TaxID=227884 RepID=A0A914Q2M0_9BILA
MQIFGVDSDEKQLDDALRAAFDIGYRYIDTAEVYKNEHIIGAVIEEYIKNGKFKREDIFITTKLPVYGMNEPERFIKKSLKNLNLDYIDLYLIHAPIPFENSGNDSSKKDETGNSIPALIPFYETWKVLEKFYLDGKLKSIGLSNFNEKQIQELYNQAKIKPQNLQVECHILFQQKELFEFCKKLNISLTAYAPLGSPGTVVKDIARFFILIRQIMQRGISVIPKSVNPNRIRENFDVFDFKFTENEMAEFDLIKQNDRLFLFEFGKNHPWHPWKEDLKKHNLL